MQRYSAWHADSVPCRALQTRLLLTRRVLQQVQELVQELQAAGGSSCRIGQPLVTCVVAPASAGLGSLVEAEEGLLRVLDPRAPSQARTDRSKHFSVDHCVTAASEAQRLHELQETVGKVRSSRREAGGL